MNHQVPNMTGRHVSNPLVGVGTTCPLMKIEVRKSQIRKKGKGREKKKKIEKKNNWEKQVGSIPLHTFF